MRAPPLALLLAKGWKTVAPRASGHKLVWQSGSQLYCSDTHFENPRLLGQVGPVDCPVAVDPVRGLTYRYVSPDSFATKDYSELRSFNLESGVSERLFALDLNKWVIWLLRYIPRNDVLLALVSTHMPGEGIHIQHQLGLFDLRKKQSLLVPLPRDAFIPLDVDTERQEVLFHGVEGYQWIHYSGHRHLQLRDRELPDGRGAAFHPTRPIVALGGGKVVLYHRDEQRFDTLTSSGQHPVWAVDGNTLWYAESSGDLFCYDMKERVAERILCVAGNPYADIKHVRPVKLSADGRYLAAVLTRRIKRRLEEGASPDNEPLFRFSHAIVVADLERREIWQHPGFSPNFDWYPSC